MSLTQLRCNKYLVRAFTVLLLALLMSNACSDEPTIEEPTITTEEDSNNLQQTNESEEIEKLKEELAKLKEELEKRAQEELDALQKQIADLEQELKDLETKSTRNTASNSAEVAALQDKIADLEKEVEDLEANATRTTASNSAEVAVLQEKITDLEKEVENLEANAARNTVSSNAEVAALQEKITDLEKEVENLEADATRTTASNSAEVTALQDKVTDLEKEVEDLSAEATQNKKNSSAEITALQKKITDLEKEVEDLEAEATRKTASNSARIIALQEKITELEKEIETLETDATQNKANNSAEVTALQEKIDELEKEIETLETDATQNKANNSAEVTALQEKITNLEKEVEDLEAAATKRSTDSDTQIDALEKRIEDLEKNLTKSIGNHFLQVVTIGSLSDVKELITSKAVGIDYVDPSDGRTAIMIAARHGHLSIVEYFISEAADLDVQSREVTTIGSTSFTGFTALIYAIVYKHENIAAKIIDAKADVDLTDNVGYTALMWATQQNLLPTVRKLSTTANINHQSNNKLTPLMMATILGHSNIVTFLLSKSPQINIQSEHAITFNEVNYSGFTALMYAIQNKDETIASELIATSGINLELKDSGGNTALTWAVRHNLPNTVKALIDKSATLDVVDDSKYTPLIWAASLGYLPIVKHLITAGANLNFQSKAEVSSGEDTYAQHNALMHAILNNEEDVAAALIAASGADLTLQDNGGHTALIWAAIQGLAATTKKIVALVGTAGVDAVDNRNLTPLIWASLLGHTDVVGHLLSGGADVNFKSTHTVSIEDASYTGQTALMYAITHQKGAVVDKIIDENLKNKNVGLNINLQDNSGQTPLIWAVRQNSPSIVSILLSFGADYSIVDNDMQFTPLMWAVRLGQLAIVNRLIAANIDLNHQSDATLPYQDVGYTKLTALMYTLIYDQPDIAAALINASANLELKDSFGQTALIWAVKFNATSTLQKLIDASANLNVVDLRGATPLIWAASLGYLSVMNQLTAAGVNLNYQSNAKNKIGSIDYTKLTALMYALLSSQSDAAVALIDAGANLELKDHAGQTALTWAVRLNNASTVQKLIDAKANLNVADRFSYTPLVWASRYGFLDVTKKLIAAGANLNYQSGAKHKIGTIDYTKRTALMYAVVHNKPDIAAALIDAGANLELKDNAGQTALTWAVRHSASKTLQKLIEAKANLNVVDLFNRTPLIWAAVSGLLDPTNRLIAGGVNLNYQSMAVHQSGAYSKLTALMYAIATKNEKVAAALIAAKNIDLSVQDSRKYTAVSWATRLNLKSTLQLMIDKLKAKSTQEKDKAINHKANLNVTPLMFATIFGYTSVVEYLIAEGADLSLVGSLEVTINEGERSYKISGHTALMYAIIYKNTQATTALINAMVSASLTLDQKDNIGQTALILAARLGLTNSVKKLVDAGASIDLKDNDGYTALIRAAANKVNVEIAKYLVTTGKANHLLTDKNNKKALDHAKANNDTDMITYLESL